MSHFVTVFDTVVVAWPAIIVLIVDEPAFGREANSTDCFNRPSVPWYVREYIYSIEKDT